MAFYLELQNHGLEENRKVNEFNIKLSKELDIPLVATNDVHYVKKRMQRHMIFYYVFKLEKQ